MIKLTALRLAGLALMAIVLLPAVPLQAAEDEPEASSYGDTYTEAELAALQEALHAGNMTIADMQFEKNYAKGHACFPIVHEMMKDPLLIASWMDGFAAAMQRDGGIDHDHYRLLVNANSLAKTEHDSGYSEAAAQAGINSQEELLQLISAAFSGASSSEPAGYAEARQKITVAMSWHDFEGRMQSDNPEADAADAELYALLGTLEQPELYPYADFYRMINELAAIKLDRSIFPSDTPLITYTPHGRIALGTPGDDHYSGDYAVLIDPGGDDHYDNCRIGAAFGIATQELGDGRLAFFADLGGDDFYDCADVDITLGAAVLGVAAFYDLGSGNDRYLAGSCSLGAAMGGIATFYDDGGSDVYEGKTFTQGAAGFGIGIMIDDSQGAPPAFDSAEGNSEVIDAHERDASQPDMRSAMDNDSYSAWTMAQAFARTRGVALCINKRGNETYSAGGVYLHAPLFADRYQSFSQGFAIGERDIDYAGGIAMLMDYEGNDRYLGDIYNQGVGYWYSAGLLWDGGGNDLYEMVQYGQGSGIHLAIGGLVDVSGNDGYIMHSGLGQGGSHDFAASILHDRGGDDRYMGTTSCNGCAVTNSVGLHIDRSGNDTYGARREHGINAATAARGFGSIGVLVDMAGKDDYLGMMADGEIWRHMDIGMGWDIADREDAPATVGGVDTLSGKEVIPEIISYEGPLTQEVFDELWEISIRWEVGDNRVIVPKARERLAAWGSEVLPLISVEMDQDSSLAVRGFVGVFNLLLEEHREGVLAVLSENAASPELFRRKNALRTIGEMKLLEAEDTVAGLLADKEIERLAIGTLGLIGSHSADTELVLRLHPDTPEPILIAAIIAATDLKIDCLPALMRLLEHPIVSVRSATISQLKKQWEHYAVAMAIYLQLEHNPANRVGLMIVNNKLTTLNLDAERKSADSAASPLMAEFIGFNSVGKRAVMEILHVADPTSEVMNLLPSPQPDEYFWSSIWRKLAESDDWGVRADAFRLLNTWKATAAGKGSTIWGMDNIENFTEWLLNQETNEYVLRVARGDV